jgi:hypothetical protein
MALVAAGLHYGPRYDSNIYTVSKSGLESETIVYSAFLQLELSPGWQRIGKSVTIFGSIHRVAGVQAAVVSLPASGNVSGSAKALTRMALCATKGTIVLLAAMPRLCNR